MNGASFKVLNWEIPLWIFITIFAVIAVVSIGLYIWYFAKTKKVTSFGKKTVSNDEFVKLEKFEDLRNDYEMEIARVRKYFKAQK